MNSIGKLKHLVSIMKPTHTTDSNGNRTTTWTKVADTLAAIEPLSARDLIAAQADQSEVTTRIIIRFRSDIDPSCRIDHGNVIYKVHGIVPDLYSGNRFLTIPASMGVSHNGD